jgi:L-fuculose-phosphate aldolase
VRCGAGLYRRGLVASTSGNLSGRLEVDRILITPAGFSKGRLRTSDLLVTDLEGRPLRPARAVPSTELPMHLEVYRRRPDVGAVIHAHPPYATALTVAGISFPDDVLPEVLLTLGEVPTTRLARPSSDDDARAIEELIGDHDALLLDRHGTLTVGRTIEQAMLVLEQIEHVARVFWLATALGRVERLPSELVDALRREKKR